LKVKQEQNRNSSISLGIKLNSYREVMALLDLPKKLIKPIKQSQIYWQWPIIISGVIAATAVFKPILWPGGFGINADKSVTTTVEKDPQGKITKTVETTKTDPGKTLWDWLSLLGVPITLAILGYGLQQIQQKRAEEVAKEQRELAADETKEEVLQVYFDRLSALLVDKNLLAITAKVNSEEPEKSKATPEEQELLGSAVDVIRARTLSIFRRFENDKERKTSVILFLYETELILINKNTGGEADNRNRSLLSLKNADLSGANLSGANLESADLSNVNLSRANLSGANLRNANLKGTNLGGTNLYNADLVAADLSLANLSGANLHYANLNGADLGMAILKNADLSHAILHKVNFCAVDLRDVNLNHVTLSGADFSGVDLRDMNFSNLDLSNAQFFGSELIDANLSGANLSGAYLIYADLSNANLSGTILNNSDLSNANFSGAIFSDADLPKQIHSAINWQNARYDSEVRKLLEMDTEL
jgi:uncharacterized protein YjbI with pentapeptide repeats